MAGLTLAALTGPARVTAEGDTINRKSITGSGGDATAVAAASSDNVHIIWGGRLSCDGADRMDILSNATVLDALQYPARTTAEFPKGVQTASGEALNLNKLDDAGTTVQGWIDYITIPDDQFRQQPR